MGRCLVFGNCTLTPVQPSLLESDRFGVFVSVVLVSAKVAYLPSAYGMASWGLVSACEVSLTLTRHCLRHSPIRKRDGRFTDLRPRLAQEPCVGFRLRLTRQRGQTMSGYVVIIPNSSTFVKVKWAKNAVFMRVCGILLHMCYQKEKSGVGGIGSVKLCQKRVV